MATLKPRPSVEVFPPPDGDLYLLGGAAGGDVVLRQATPAATGLCTSSRTARVRSTSWRPAWRPPA